MSKKVIIDCDVGVDDALALILAFSSPELEVLGITGVNGNVSLPRVMKNIEKVLTLIRPPNRPWVARGAQGLYFKNRDEEIWMDAFRVQAVDTTGAGDAFRGGLACGLAEGKPIREALKMANAAGGMAAIRLGAQPSLPDRRDLKRFLKKHP